MFFQFKNLNISSSISSSAYFNFFFRKRLKKGCQFGEDSALIRICYQSTNPCLPTLERWYALVLSSRSPWFSVKSMEMFVFWIIFKFSVPLSLSIKYVSQTYQENRVSPHGWEPLHACDMSREQSPQLSMDGVGRGGKMKQKRSEQFSEICEKSYCFSIYCHQHNEGKN